MLKNWLCRQSDTKCRQSETYTPKVGEMRVGKMRCRQSEKNPAENFRGENFREFRSWCCKQTYVGHMHIIVGLYPPLFTCMVAVKSLYLQQTCVFSLSIVLVMCSCNLSIELSRTFLFSYLSFCDCHLFLIAICNEVNFPPTCYAHHVRLITVWERAQQRFCGDSWKFSPQNLGGWHPLVRQKRAIREYFLCENRIFHQSTKVFSLESFPLYHYPTHDHYPSV